MDDDPATVSAVEQLVRSAGFESAAFSNGRDLVRRLRHENFDLFILDWQVPDFSGIQVIEWIRNGIGSRVPMMLLTNRTADEDIVTGLRAGADDFMTKPFRPAVLLARIEALLRRSTGAAGKDRMEIGPYVFHVANRTVSAAGVDVALRQREFSLAILMFRNLNCALSRSYILETIWGVDPDVSTRTLDMHISRIRAKLNLRPEHGFRLATIYGYGYRLEEVVE